MTNAMLNRFVAARVRVLKAVESREVGQGALEYIGMVIVAAVLILAVISAFSNGGFRDAITTKVNSVKNALDGFEG